MAVTTKPAKVSKGMKFRAVYADSNALWKVLRHLGGGAWLCEIVNEPIEIDGETYDGDYGGEQKSWLSREILGSIGMSSIFQDCANKTEEFYARLNVGDIIHYCDGFGKYVRCAIVLADDGEKYAKPIALVGDWKKRDLPRRSRDGSINLGYQAKKILEPDENQSRCRFDVSVVHEGEYQHKSGRCPGDPAELVPIDLTVPEMNAKEKEDAQCFKLLSLVRNAVDDGLMGTAPPQEVLATVKGILRGYSDGLAFARKSKN